MKDGEMNELASSPQNRRRFIRKSFLLIGAASATCGTSEEPPAVAPPAQPAPRPPESPALLASSPPLVAPPPGLRVGRVDQIPPGSSKTVSFRGLPVIVINEGGTLRAVSGICTHENCEVEWRGEWGLLQCPCHDGRYDTHGKVVSGPPPAPLLEFPVMVEEGTAFLLER